MVEVYGELLSGSRFCQSAGKVPAFSAIWSMSYASASVTTSASSPSITERACLPEPPCDWRMVTSCPVLFFQYPANCLLKSSYSSLVGSYDTLSKVTGFGAGGGPEGTIDPARSRVNANVFMGRNLAQNEVWKRVITAVSGSRSP